MFLKGLARDTERGHGPGLETLIGDLLFTAFTNPIDIFAQPVKRFIDLLEELLLPFFDAHREILIHFGGRLITDVGKCLRPFAFRQPFTRFIQDGLPLLLQLTPDCAVFSAG